VADESEAPTLEIDRDDGGLGRWGASQGRGHLRASGGWWCPTTWCSTPLSRATWSCAAAWTTASACAASRRVRQPPRGRQRDRDRSGFDGPRRM